MIGLEISLTGDLTEVLDGVRALEEDYGFRLTEDAEFRLECEHVPGQTGLKVEYRDGAGYLMYEKRHHFFRALGLVLEKLQKSERAFTIQETPQFTTLGPMFDLSRNAVLRQETFEDMFRKLAVMGYDSAMLYMEDTYEVAGEPYFGYMRGRYDQAELKALDDYAYQFGIELIPCIQTLAHLEEFLKWDAAYSYKDTRGALLLESADTYDLLDRMIRSVSEPFRSKRIHIGMDEAEEVGRGRFLNQHGYKPRFELMVTHLEKVLQITRENGLEAMMWSDMFLKLASETGDHYSKTTDLPEEMIGQIPGDIQLVYWQYNQTDVAHYEQIFQQHNRFKKKPAFAGGIWVWNTFAPNYNLSLKASEAALTACKSAGVEDVFVTLWGDDGYENHPYAALFGLQFYAEHAYRQKPDDNQMKERANFCTGIDADMFLMLNELDTPPGVAPGTVEQTNPSKFLLWQDVLLGLFDKHVEELDLQTYYNRLGDKLEHNRAAIDSPLERLFIVAEKLSRVLALKAGIGVDLKKAYDNKNYDDMRRIANEILPEITDRVQALRAAHRDQWLQWNKPFGWEVIDIRYGGLVNRLDTAAQRINDFLAGVIDSIEELDQERLYFSPGVANAEGLGWNSYYYRMASPNVFFHVLPIY